MPRLLDFTTPQPTQSALGGFGGPINFSPLGPVREGPQPLGQTFLPPVRQAPPLPQPQITSPNVQLLPEPPTAAEGGGNQERLGAMPDVMPDGSINWAKIIGMAAPAVIGGIGGALIGGGRGAATGALAGAAGTANFISGAQQTRLKAEEFRSKQKSQFFEDEGVVLEIKPDGTKVRHEITINTGGNKAVEFSLKEIREQRSDLIKEGKAMPFVKQSPELERTFDALEASFAEWEATDPSRRGVKEIAIINFYQRLIDPATVREGDVALQQSAQSFFEKMKLRIKQLEEGKVITAALGKQMVELGQAVLTSHKRNVAEQLSRMVESTKITGAFSDSAVDAALKTFEPIMPDYTKVIDKELANWALSGDMFAERVLETRGRL